ncbi:MAG: contractile injection system protein, VgrG/Pvc8 family, partial [Candidatus Thiodiazotropha sp.]
MKEPAIKPARVGINQSHYFFTLTGTTDIGFRVIAFKNTKDRGHALSACYGFELTLAVDQPLDGASLLNQKCRFTLTDEETSQELHGLVIMVTERGQNLGSYEYGVHLVSPLYPLKLNRQSRNFLRCTVVEIAQEVLKKGGFPMRLVQFQTRHDYPQLEFVAQFRESDYDFLCRQLARWGLFFYFEQTAESCRMVIRDHYQGLPRQEQVRLESIDWQRQAYQAETDCCTLAPGQTFTLTEHPDEAFNGDYLVVSVSHQGNLSNSGAATQNGAVRHYSNRLILHRHAA